MLETLKIVLLECLLSVGLDRTATDWWSSWNDNGSRLTTHWAVALGEALRKSGKTGRAIEMLRLHWKRDGHPLVALSLYRCLTDGSHVVEGATHGHIAEARTIIKHALAHPMPNFLKQQVLGVYCLRLHLDGDYAGAAGVAKELSALTDRLRNDVFRTVALVALSMDAFKMGDHEWRSYLLELHRRPYARLAKRYFPSELRVLESATEDR